MHVYRRLIATLSVALILMVLVGCAATPKKSPSDLAAQALKEEQSKPLTPAPSKPAELKWPAAPTASETELNNTAIKYYQLINEGKTEDARATLLPMAGAKNREIQVALGQAEYGVHRLDEAAEALVRALDVDPKSSIAHNNLANVYREQKKFDLAVAEYQKAIAIDPQNEAAIMNLQGVLLTLERPRWAEQVLRNAVVPLAKSVSVRNALGDLMRTQQRYSEARGFYEAALTLDPKNEHAKNSLDSLPKQ